MSGRGRLERLLRVMVTRILWKPAHVLLPLLLSAALLAPVLRSRAATDGEAAGESALAFERQLLDALRRGDREQLDLLVADDFELRRPHSRPLGKTELIARAVKQGPLLAAVETQGLEARVLGNMTVVSGSRRSLVRVVEDDGVIDRQLFVHVHARHGGRWRLLYAFEIPDPG